MQIYRYIRLTATDKWNKAIRSIKWGYANDKIRLKMDKIGLRMDEIGLKNGSNRAKNGSNRAKNGPNRAKKWIKYG